MIIAPVLPHDDIAHAGGVYLQRLHHALIAAGAEITFLVHDSEDNRAAMDGHARPDRVILLGRSRRHALHEKALMRVAWTLDPRIRSRNPTWPPLPLLVQLLLVPEARAAIRRAQVVDVQWPEYSRLVPLIRMLNPHARILATLHDVLSQRWARARSHATSDPMARRAVRSAGRLERTTLRRADAIVVFSDKDRDLLVARERTEASRKVVVVAPPLALPLPVVRSPRREDPEVVFVSLLARGENEEGVLWLLREIWPSVVDRMPRARLRLVGKGASPRVLDAAAAAQGVEVTGFVSDLTEVYATASACVVPLRLGAGVKFKTVEALIAGVPTVTTAVGAEGIADGSRFAALSDDADDLADALVRVLRDPTEAESAAAVTQVWARERYSIERFLRQVARIYELDGGAG